MLDLFLGLRHLVRRRLILIDNAVFRLHWQLTSLILFSFSVVITTRQYIGNPIFCVHKDEITVNLYNTYCWMHSTFTVPSSFNKKAGSEVAYLGVDNSYKSRNSIKRYPYYQWVGFSLFIQGICFYAPYYLWKLWENGLMRSISMGMQIAIISDEEKGRKRQILLKYLTSHFGCHRVYTLKYFLCEFLCLLNVILQTWYMDWFFDGEFLMLGFNTINYLRGDPKNETVNPLLFVFPRVTKCTFYDYGISGDVQRHDIQCLLPINVVNEKIYLFLWFWFLFLAISTIFVLVYRVLIVFVPSSRPYFLYSRCRLSRRKDLKIICRYGNIGDWFVLYMLGNNLDPIIMTEVTGEIGARIRTLRRQKYRKYSV